MHVTAKRPTGTLSSPKCRFLLFLLSKVLCKACVKGEGSWRSFPEVLKARGVNVPCSTFQVHSPYFLFFSCLMWADLSSRLRLFDTIGLKNRMLKKIPLYTRIQKSFAHMSIFPQLFIFMFDVGRFEFLVARYHRAENSGIEKNTRIQKPLAHTSRRACWWIGARSSVPQWE